MKYTIPTLALLAACVLSACSGDTTTAPQNAAVGRWVLTTVDDVNLPIQVTQADTTVEIVADTLAVLAGGTYSNVAYEVLTIGTVATPLTHHSTGTWGTTATVSTFTDATDQTTMSGILANGSGSLKGNGSIVLGDTLTETYRKL